MGSGGSKKPAQGTTSNTTSSKPKDNTPQKKDDPKPKATSSPRKDSSIDGGSNETSSQPTSTKSDGKDKGGTKDKQRGSAVRESESGAFSIKKAEKLFEKYKDPEGDYISPDTMTAFCNDIGIDAEDVVMIVISWHMKAQEMGYYQKDEFLNGLKDLNADTVEKVKAKIQQLRDELKDANKQRDIYKFAWHFAKDDAEKKTISLEMTEGLLQLILPGGSHVDNFCAFLKDQKDYKGINMDQWMSFYEFHKTMKTDMSDYDDQGAWPVLIDLFVEWFKEKGPVATGATDSGPQDD